MLTTSSLCGLATRPRSASSHLTRPFSFRHTGAINEYEKTGDLRTVQTVMGHGFMAVTLGYLRGLELCELSTNSMPALN